MSAPLRADRDVGREHPCAPSRSHAAPWSRPVHAVSPPRIGAVALQERQFDRRDAALRNPP
jgi:hypothetical protein